jgi:hypothetical protein
MSAIKLLALVATGRYKMKLKTERDIKRWEDHVDRTANIHMRI